MVLRYSIFLFLKFSLTYFFLHCGMLFFRNKFFIRIMYMIRSISYLFKKIYFLNIFILTCSFGIVDESSIDSRLPDGLVLSKKLIIQMSDYFNFKELETVYINLYKLYPEFFTKNPKDFFPLKTKNDKIVFDFIDACFPLYEFFSEMQWGETGFPVSVGSLENNIKAMFLTPNSFDITKMEGNGVICIPGATFPSMLTRLLEAKKNINEKIKGIYFLVRENRENSKLSYETVKNIVNEIELKLGRKLLPDEIEFVSTHNKNEYEFAKIIQYFFDQENKTEIFLAKEDHSKYEKCLDFVKFAVSNFPELKNIIIVSHNIFTFYDKYIWQKVIGSSPFTLSVIPLGHTIPLIDKKNPEGVLVRFIRLSNLLLQMMKENF